MRPLKLKLAGNVVIASATKYLDVTTRAVAAEGFRIPLIDTEVHAGTDVVAGEQIVHPTDPSFTRFLNHADNQL
jgi:hypothetical protein